MEALEHTAQITNELAAAKEQLEAAQCGSSDIALLREDLSTAKAALETIESDKTELQAKLAAAVADLDVAFQQVNAAAAEKYVPCATRRMHAKIHRLLAGTHMHTHTYTHARARMHIRADLEIKLAAAETETEDLRKSLSDVSVNRASSKNNPLSAVCELFPCQLP